MLRVRPHCLSLSPRILALLLCGAWSAVAPVQADTATAPAIPPVAAQPDAPRAVPRPRVAQGPIGELSEDDRAAARAAMQAMEPAVLEEFRLRLKRATPDERADMLRAIAR